MKTGMAYPGGNSRGNYSGATTCVAKKRVERKRTKKEKKKEQGGLVAYIPPSIYFFLSVFDFHFFSSRKNEPLAFETREGAGPL